MDDTSIRVAAGTDLLALTDLETAPLVIKGPDDQPFIGADGKPWTLTIAGPSHPVAYRARDEARERFGRKLSGKADGRDADPVVVEIATLAARVLAWTPVEFGGQPFPWSPENAMKALGHAQIVRDQVAAFLNAAESFTRPLFKS